MNKNRFWESISSAKKTAGCWQNMYTPLRDTLLRLEEPDLVRWQQIFGEYKKLSNKEKLAAAAAVMHNGISDDGFDYFRGWLIAQGKEAFLMALADPDSLADVMSVQAFGREVLSSEYTPLAGYVEAARFERILCVATDAFESRPGNKGKFRCFFDALDNNPLSEREKADIACEVQYAKDIDMRWDCGLQLKEKLPRLYKTFNGIEIPQKQQSLERRSLADQFREANELAQRRSTQRPEEIRIPSNNEPEL